MNHIIKNRLSLLMLFTVDTIGLFTVDLIDIIYHNIHGDRPDGYFS